MKEASTAPMSLTEVLAAVGSNRQFAQRALDALESMDDAIDVSASQFFLDMNRLMSLVTYDLESRVHRQMGWSWSGFRVLFVLWVDGPSDMKSIAQKAGMSRASVSAAIKTLERDGFVRRERPSEDGRVWIVSLTAAAARQVESTLHQQSRRESEWLQGVSVKRRRMFSAVVDDVMDNIADVDFDIRYL